MTCTIVYYGFNIFVLLVLTSLSFLPPFTFGNPASCPIDYIYQLGDSLADTGNGIRILPVGPLLPSALPPYSGGPRNFSMGTFAPTRVYVGPPLPPYGETFPGTPTGRWSDGRLMIDYIATAINLPLLKPYLDTTASFNNGINFAVVAATALDIVFLATKGIIIPPFTIPLPGQLQQFRNYLGSTCGSIPGECGRRLNRSLVLVGEIGGNEINFGLAQGRTVDELKALVPIINSAIINATREVIRLGAVRVVIPGNFPIGCFPNNLNMFKTSDPTAYDVDGCLRNLNDLAVFQNSNLQQALASLRLEFPNVAIIYFDYYNAFQTVLRSGPALGFDGTTLLKACCGTGTFGTCGALTLGVALCSDPARYISWDGLHLTQEAYRRRRSRTFLYKI